MGLPAKDAEIRIALLPDAAEPSELSVTDRSASVSGAVFNLSTSIVGAGIMSIPATMKVLGFGPALLLVALVAFLCDLSVEFLLRYTGPARVSYAAVMRQSFGRAGSTLLQVFVALNNFGVLVTYLVIIGDVMSGSVGAGGEAHWGVLPAWFGGARWWNAREVVLLVTLVVFLLPLLCFRRVDSLRFSSAISVLLAVVFVLISSGMAIYALSTGTTKMPRPLPNFSLLSSAFELFTAVPVIVLAFTFHFNVHPIRAELKSSSEMTIAVRLSLLLCSTIYAAVGFFGYALFGDDTMADILSNFDSSSGMGISPVLNDAVRLSYALHLVLVFPLLFFSMRINVDGLLFPGARPVAFDRIRFFSLTVVMAASSYVAAIAIPSIWVLFQFFGSTCAVCISLIFPAAIVLRDVQGISTNKDKIIATGLIVLAMATSSIAIASNFVHAK